MKQKYIYALGFFDGVHLGHQALLDTCLTLAKEAGCRAGVVTFTSHPDTLVAGKTPKLINTTQDRKGLLYAYGMETVVELPFDRELMTTHWSEFLSALTRENAAGFVCGSDFRFGAGGSGTAKKLLSFCQSRNMPCAAVPQQLLNGIRISSTYIRSLLETGDMASANRYLGHPHILTGQVVSGQHLGRTIGIPTANLHFPEELVQPKLGVYACIATVAGKRYPAVTNIGTRPTVNGQGITVEPWLLDFAGDLYGTTLTLEFHKFLRPEEKFPSLEALRTEIQKNADQTLACVKEYL